VGEPGLRAGRHRHLAAVGGQDDRLGVLASEDLALADVVDDEQLAALALELGATVAGDAGVLVAGLGGEADDERTSVTVAPRATAACAMAMPCRPDERLPR
jgi:hypothetical protein